MAFHFMIYFKCFIFISKFIFFFQVFIDINKALPPSFLEYKPFLRVPVLTQILVLP